MPEIDGVQVMIEDVAVTGAPTFEALTIMIESFGLTDSHEVAFIYALAESLAIGSTLTGLGAYIGNIDDPVAVGDVLRPVLMQILQDTFEALDDGTLAEIYRLMAITDGVALASSLGLSVSTRLSEALALAYVMASVQQGQVDDALIAAGSLEVLTSVFAVLTESMAVQSALTGLAVFTVLANDGLEIGDETEVRANYLESLAEGLGFSVSLVIDGIPYLGTVMNSETRGITEYTNYDFNSLANFKGVLYGANGAGLFRLEGADDAGTPIDAHIRTGLVRVANGLQARCDSAYIGYRSDGSMQMKVSVSGATGTKLSYIYDMVAVTAESTRPNRVKFGRGLKASYWSFQLNNLAGADFSADIVEILPIPLERRIP